MKFRKVYFVCENNKAIWDQVLTGTAYCDKEYADKVCQQWQDRAKQEVDYDYNANKEMPTYKVHAFYLISEDCF